MTGTVDAVCVKGLKIKKTGNWIMALLEHPLIDIPFDGNYPIDITTMGHDAVWMDRLKFETNAGSRWFGSDNTHGWCLSRDKHDGFDKYATHEGCFSTLSFYPNGKVYGSGERGYNYASYDIVRKTENMCADLGRRRVEDDAGMVVPSGLASDAEALDLDELFVDVENLDDDPAGEFPKQVHNALDGLVVTTLHKAIRDMVRNNDDVTYGQIDKLLNSAMLEAEHLEEQIEHEGEVLAGSEPEAFESSEPEALEGSNDNRNVEGRLQNLEESP